MIERNDSEDERRGKANEGKEDNTRGRKCKYHEHSKGLRLKEEKRKGG